MQLCNSQTKVSLFQGKVRGLISSILPCLPSGSKGWKDIILSNLFAHPSGRRPRKIICGANEFFSGVGMIFFDPVSNFQCATPRGLIRLLTVGGNLPQIALLVEAILRRVARSLPHSVLYQRKALGATFAMVHPAFSISRIFKPYFCIS